MCKHANEMIYSKVVHALALGKEDVPFYVIAKLLYVLNIELLLYTNQKIVVLFHQIIHDLTIMHLVVC